MRDLFSKCLASADCRICAKTWVMLFTKFRECRTFSSPCNNC